MRNTTFHLITAIFLICFIPFSAMAWDHGVSIGYGGGRDINHHNDTNSGGILSAEFMSLKKKSWFNLTFDGSMGEWYSTAPANKNLFTAALTLAFRTYLYHFSKATPYVLISSGPAYLSSRKFGENTQAANVAFQTSAGVGMEIGQAKRVDLSLKLIHYSNAYTMYPNQGFNIFYVGSIGYLF